MSSVWSKSSSTAHQSFSCFQIGTVLTILVPRKVQFGQRAGGYPVVLAFLEGSAEYVVHLEVAGGGTGWWWVPGGGGWWYHGRVQGMVPGHVLWPPWIPDARNPSGSPSSPATVVT